MGFFDAIGSVVGGLLGYAGGQSAASGARKGAKINAKAALRASRKNLAWQKKFAQRGIRWRTKDARRAGVSPLVALGAQTMSFAPSFVSGNPGDGLIQGAGYEAKGLESLGQGFSRAIGAFDEPEDRNDAYMRALQGLQLENAALQNQYLASQIAQNTQAGNPPAGPSVSSNRYLIDGQGDTRTGSASLVKDEALKRVASDPDRLSQEAGAVTDVGFLKTRDGYAPTRSADAAERLEDDFLGSVQHFIRNRIYQPIMDLEKGAPFKAPPGKKWAFNHITGEYFLRDAYSNRDRFPSGRYNGGSGF